MLGSLGWQELLIVLVIVALIFGASRVAGLGKAMGQGIREFRQEARMPDATPTSDDADAAAPASAEAPKDASGETGQSS